MPVSSSEGITIPKIMLAGAITALSGAMGWVVSAVIEVDRTQESVLARINSMENQCRARDQELHELHELIDTKAADRFTGKDAENEREKNDVQHTFMWSAINELQRDLRSLHDALFKK